MKLHHKNKAVMTQRYAHLAQKDIISQAPLLNFDIDPQIKLEVV